MDRRRQRAPDASGAAAGDLRPCGCPRRRAGPRPVRSRPANLEDLPPRRLRPRPGGAPAWLPIGRLRVSSPVVSGSVPLPVLLPERSLWIGSAGGESRSQRSPADSLEVPSRGCAVPCLTGTDQGITTPRPGPLRASLVSLACSSRRPAALLLRDTQDAAAGPLRHRSRYRSHASQWPAIAPAQTPAVGSVPGLSSLHECSLGRQGSVRARIPCTAAATGGGRSGGVDHGIPQPAS